MCPEVLLSDCPLSSDDPAPSICDTAILNTPEGDDSSCWLDSPEANSEAEIRMQDVYQGGLLGPTLVEGSQDARLGSRRRAALQPQNCLREPTGEF